MLEGGLDMSDRDYYEILGLTPRADGAMVDQAYWHLARKYQQLAATNAHAQRLIDELNEAYGVIGNPRLREQYDGFRDDVLIRNGMLKPVASKPKRRTKKPADAKDAATATGSLPSLSIKHWQTYGVAAVIAALAFAGAWQGVNIIFVGSALALGVFVSLTPTIRTRVSEVDFRMPQVSMPAMPSIQMPNISEVTAPAIRELGIGEKDELWDADELRASTAQTITRWRQSVGLKTNLRAETDDAPPNGTLVDIVETERSLDGHDEPLAAVLDILRGANRASS